jgi:hypothetical protein
MFEDLILATLADGPKSTHDLYRTAEIWQPADCTSTPCPHRDEERETDLEWQHQLRRDQQRLAKQGIIVSESGKWHLVHHRAYLRPEEADALSAAGEDEKPYLPTSGDSRGLVMRQIKARRGQHLFRNALRDRYGDVCLISGCMMMDVVEAAHIKPYRGELDNHPGNGLLLRADLHTLFDLDLIGIQPAALTVRVHPKAKQAGYGCFDGAKLRCTGAEPSSRVWDFKTTT